MWPKYNVKFDKWHTCYLYRFMQKYTTIKHCPPPHTHFPRNKFAVLIDSPFGSQCGKQNLIGFEISAT